MQSNPHRWFGVGQSSAHDSAKAGTEAAEAAIGGRTPKAVFVFCSVAHDLPVLMAAVRRECNPETVIVGSTTIGELGNVGMTVGGVSIAALGGDGFTVRTRMAHLKEHGPRAAGALAAEAAHGLHDDHQVLVLLCDGLAGSPHEVVRGAYTTIGAAIPMVGGFSGDDQRFQATCQFYGEQRHGDKVLTDAVIGVALGSDAPIGIGIAHGWHRLEPPMIVTRSRGGRVYELDDEPALDVMLRRNGMDGRPAADLFHGLGALPALGLSRRNGEDIRVIHDGDDDERSILGMSDVPQGALCWLMEADHEALIQGATDSCREALDGLGGKVPLGVLAFDCGVRRGRLGPDGMQEEMAAMRSALGNTPYAGFYTSGEIARVHGALGTHHLTLVTLALA
jgi:hypothetical protein